MDIVGHSTIEMAMNVYGHVTLDEKALSFGQAEWGSRGVE